MKKHYYTIGEVGNLLELKPYVIRYWETEFQQLRPRKDDGRIRKYSEENILLLKKIKDMLYTQKFTIAGARQRLKAERKAVREPREYRKDEQIEIPLLEPEVPTGLTLDSTAKQQLLDLKRTLTRMKLQCQTFSGRNK
ncbi:MAG TPA: MerR family transcriptional regulator [Candidatus Cloacimonadota bacterium]|nr:MerR family transcriptional regulator [Candidatus Cloacimonadota bacterium]HPS38723.1 MerR family transcriptional regulator [Candidatus Cloacimonadota bacterium]